MDQFDLELQNIRKVYPGNTVAVEGFDLQVQRGEFISFVGPSGCGKTTTLRMIAGLESITSGTLLIRGQDFTHVPTEKRPTSTIFQNYAIFPHMTVRENIGFGLEVRKVPTNEVAKRVDAIIEKLQLGDVANAKETSLSGGQKQRLALARGLVTEPEILLLDEPLGALDANLRKSIQEELKVLQRSLNITFIFVTHAQSEALSMGDRVVVMNAGRVEQISDPFELYTRPKSSFVARFIGRNTLIEGAYQGCENGLARVETPFGLLSGRPSFDPANISTQTGVSFVLPSEFITLNAEPSGADHQGLTCTVGSLHRIGQIVRISVRLPDDTEIEVESYAENTANLNLSPGAQVDLSWSAERATVVSDGP